MVCPKCGKNVDNDKRFCPACGLSLTESYDTSSYSEKRTNPVPYLITIVAIVLILAVAYVVVQLNNNKSDANDSNSAPANEITTEKEEVATEAKADEAVAADADEPEPEPEEEAADADIDMGEINTYISNFLEDFYSYGWVYTTNNHDSSYVAQYTVPGSNAYKIFGQDYWQERPDVVFNRIYDINVVSVEQASDGSYNAYVSYIYDLYHTDTGKTASKVEIAVDNIVMESGQLLLNNHTWKNDLPIGTNVTISDFK